VISVVAAVAPANSHLADINSADSAVALMMAEFAEWWDYSILRLSTKALCS